MEYGVYEDLIVLYPKPYSIYLRDYIQGLYYLVPCYPGVSLVYEAMSSYSIGQVSVGVRVQRSGLLVLIHYEC